MKRFFHFVLRSMQLLVLLFLLAIHYFTKRKMGMARYMVYIGRKLRAGTMFGIPVLFLLFSLLLLLSLLFLCFFWHKGGRESGFFLRRGLLLWLLPLLSLFYLIFANSSEQRDFYVFILGFSLILFLQLLLSVLSPEVRHG